MRGHVYKRGTSWTAVYDEGRDERGKRRQRSKGGFRTRAEAQRFLTDVLARLGDGSYAQPSKTTLGEFLVGEWLPAAEATVRPSTFAHYQSMLRVHVGETLFATRPRERTRPGAGSPRATAWTAGELGRFLAVPASDRLAALWRLAAVSGMRRGELLAVTWRTLDFEAATLSVDRQLRADYRFGPPKSRRSRRTIALDPETIRLLEEHRQAQLVERTLAGNAYEDQDLVFCDELGRPIHPHQLSRLFLQHRNAAGIPSGSLHTLRHTAATLMLTNGVPLHVAAARLGDDPRTPLDRYAHLLPQADRDAADRVAALLA